MWCLRERNLIVVGHIFVSQEVPVGHAVKSIYVLLAEVGGERGVGGQRGVRGKGWWVCANRSRV